MRLRIGVIDMGRKSDCWVGMAILGTGMMLASFHRCATVDVASDMLNRKATYSLLVHYLTHYSILPSTGLSTTL